MLYGRIKKYMAADSGESGGGNSGGGDGGSMDIGSTDMPGMDAMKDAFVEFTKGIRVEMKQLSDDVKELSNQIIIGMKTRNEPGIDKAIDDIVNFGREAVRENGK